MTKKGRFMRQATHRHAEMTAWLDSEEAEQAFADLSKETFVESIAVAKRNCEFNAELPGQDPAYWNAVKDCLRSLECKLDCGFITQRWRCNDCQWRSPVLLDNPNCPWNKAKEMIG
jgi:hypothetical protein